MSHTSQLLQLARFAAVAGVACGLSWQASAAVNVCEKVHASEPAEDKSEVLAKKRALENWVAHARQYGEDFARWGNAWERHFECARTDSGLFRCQAIARPCAVRQVPPDGLKPLRRDLGT